MSKCEVCGEPMPPGEEMFKFHGYSGNCPKPPLPKPMTTADKLERENERLQDECEDYRVSYADRHERAIAAEARADKLEVTLSTLQAELAEAKAELARWKGTQDFAVMAAESSLAQANELLKRAHATFGDQGYSGPIADDIFAHLYPALAGKE